MGDGHVQGVDIQGCSQVERFPTIILEDVHDMTRVPDVGLELGHDWLEKIIDVLRHAT